MTSTQRRGVLLRVADMCIDRGTLVPVAAIMAPRLGLKRHRIGAIMRELAAAQEFRIAPVRVLRPLNHGGAQLVHRIKILPVERVA